MSKGQAGRRRAAEKSGRVAESLAALLLRLKAYRVIDRRVRTHAGEIDLIARSPSGTLCFVEIKTRPTDELAVQSIGERQRERITRAAELYLAAHADIRRTGIRFDAILVTPGRLPRHLKDAWRAS